MQYFKPSAVVAATDATTAPPLKKEPAPPAPVGSKTDIGEAVNQAASALSTAP
jgi:hypothetical protein